jgi:hypothetical protein
MKHMMLLGAMSTLLTDLGFRFHSSRLPFLARRALHQDPIPSFSEESKLAGTFNRVPDKDHLLNLPHLLRHTAASRATDPRDKVFALAALMPPDQRPLLHVDYTRMTEVVFRSATAHLISWHRSGFREFAGIFPFLSESTPHYPSWVLDLSFSEGQLRAASAKDRYSSFSAAIINGVLCKGELNPETDRFSGFKTDIGKTPVATPAKLHTPGALFGTVRVARPIPDILKGGVHKADTRISSNSNEWESFCRFIAGLGEERAAVWKDADGDDGEQKRDESGTHISRLGAKGVDNDGDRGLRDSFETSQASHGVEPDSTSEEQMGVDEIRSAFAAIATIEGLADVHDNLKQLCEALSHDDQMDGDPIKRFEAIVKANSSGSDDDKLNGTFEKQSGEDRHQSTIAALAGVAKATNKLKHRAEALSQDQQMEGEPSSKRLMAMINKVYSGSKGDEDHEHQADAEVNEQTVGDENGKEENKNEEDGDNGSVGVSERFEQKMRRLKRVNPRTVLVYDMVKRLASQFQKWPVGSEPSERDREVDAMDRLRYEQDGLDEFGEHVDIARLCTLGWPWDFFSRIMIDDCSGLLKDLAGKWCFITQDGLVGIAPVGVWGGDELVMLHHSTVFTMLRQVADETVETEGTQHRILSRALVGGFMERQGDVESFFKSGHFPAKMLEII